MTSNHYRNPSLRKQGFWTGYLFADLLHLKRTDGRTLYIRLCCDLLDTKEESSANLSEWNLIGTVPLLNAC